VKIRVEGTEAEITAAVQLIATVLNVSEASDFYPNRRRGAKYLPPSAAAPILGRVYLTVTAPAATGPVRAEAERTDQPHELPPVSRKELR
jgi:hypothetical protein